MRPPGRLAAPVVAIVAVATLAGCVSLPTSGRVTGIRSPDSDESGQVVQLVPRPPGPDWTPEEIVTGFLAASGSVPSGGLPGKFAVNRQALAVAKGYLAPGYRRQWRPSLPSPTVIDSSLADLDITWYRTLPTVSGLASAVVEVASKHVETLQRAGNIVVSPEETFDFSLYEISPGQWRIETLPRHDINLLLLTLPDFQRDYQPRDLYFFADASSRVLVPDTVFIPEQAPTQAGAQDLASYLLGSVPNGVYGTGPPGWLNEATTTAFPAGAKIASVSVSGVKATVNLDLPDSARPSSDQITQMEAQLVWTLTSSPYGSGTSGIGSVQFVVHPGTNKLLLLRKFLTWVPQVGSWPLYFQTLGAAGHPVIETRGKSGSLAPVPTPHGLGTGLLTDVAILPSDNDGGNGPAVLGACRGRVVYLTSFRYRANVIKQVLPAPCTTLSWDGEGNLWVTSGNAIYLFPAIKNGALVAPSCGGTPPCGVLSSSLRLPKSDSVSSFQVAPDGVRAAMIVRSKTGSKVYVAAISANAGYHYLAQSLDKVQVGSDIADPTALAWQTPDDLLVLGSPAGGSSQRYVYQVPLDGEPSAKSGVPAPPGALWLAADGLGVAVGVPGRPVGQIWLSGTWDGSWFRLATGGSTPDYFGAGIPAGAQAP